MNIHIRTCVYHDSSSKGLKHGIKHKRHDCWRGEISIWQHDADGKLQRIRRIRKRFPTPEQAREWTKSNDLSRAQQP